MSDVRVGLVGCGRVAEHGYVPALARARGLVLAATADPERTRRELLASGVPGYDGPAELLAAGGVDVVIIATPSRLHLAHAEVAAGAGVTALVEKPPGTSLDDALSLERLRPQPRLALNRRFEPQVARLRQALAMPGTVELRLVLQYRRGTWRARESSDDALLDLGPHAVDLASWLAASEPVRVRCSRLEHDRAELDLELERGWAAISLACDRPHQELVDARLGARPVGRYLRGGTVRSGLARLRPGRVNPLVPSLSVQLESFASVAAGIDPGVLGRASDGVRVMAVLDAARDSFRSGRWMRARAPVS